MLNKILFPVDFSEAAEKAKTKLLEINNCKIGEIILLNVVEKTLFSYSPYNKLILSDLYDEKEEMELAEEKLKVWKKDFEIKGIKVETKILTGDPFDKILEYCDKENCTSIFIGYKGIGENNELFIGSTADKIARKADVPVIVVR
jgi:nucleotide-binding universal stress UspA family protein